ncbi:uncharacterized protein (DUF2249 family) [Rhodopseudomonas faecalis]|uniref:Uncharacterized protein (DUF2249 family) n=1 Tax=Rhodopseudomonas faecalis TaxID=99655 RepID=A0A318TDS0_9BRAD|nr:DUF2249 domain-containing protein [Rhodopseudomonas faecalis]PYF02743.1 uncharacterized protein (DUF2249 family) [Rhodopseudomonas faecalis]
MPDVRDHNPVNNEAILDVRTIEPQRRHDTVRRLIDRLPEDASLQLISDHSPQPIRGYFEMVHGDQAQWHDLELGPTVWRVRLTRTAL